MTTNQYAEERIRGWLRSTTHEHLPDQVLAATFDRTRRLPQTSRRRRWASLPLRPLPMAFGTVAVALALVAVSVRLGDRPIQFGGANQPLSTQFGGAAPISGQWTSDSSVAFTVQFAAPEDEHLYWRAAVYDQFDLTAWRQSVVGGYDVAAGDDVLRGSFDEVTEDGRRSVTFTVSPEDFRGTTILSPQSPTALDTPVRVSYVDKDARFVASIDRTGSDAYAVTALVRDGGDAGGVTANELRAAGTSYPKAISDRYLQVPPGAIPDGGDAEHLLETVLAQVADPDNPYDVASTMVDYFQSPANFQYDTDVRDLACEGLSTVECFARFKRGYCQHYATTMAILLRERGIPTRLVAGFLPGARDGLDETVTFNAAHAWVEVYFPGSGWVEFDPTGGGVAALQPLPAAAPAP